MIKTFRGFLTDGQQRKIRLSTKKGKIGYKVINLQLFPQRFGSIDQKSTVAIWKVKQTSASNQLDFADGNLLGGAVLSTDNSENNPLNSIVFFEQEVFNQDIFITHLDAHGDNSGCNYYLELEAFNMTDNAAAVSTLRDIRLNPQVGA
jgi:hypothetical protein